MSIRVDNLSSLLTENNLEMLRQLGRITISFKEGYAKIETDDEDNAIHILKSVGIFGNELQFSKLPNSRDPVGD